MKISVVIPAHNAEAWIEQAVTSAFEQTVKPDEVIVGSDGSQDKTAEIAKKAGAKVLELSKGNANVARNAGIKASTGDLIFFLDADDWFKPDKIERHLEFQSSGMWSMTMDPATTIDLDGNTGRLAGPPLDSPVGYGYFTNRRYWYGGSSFATTRDKLEAIGGWREELKSQQDIDIWLRLAYRHGPAYVMGTSHTLYRLTAGSTSRSPKNVLSNLDNLLEGLPFLSFSQQRQLKSHVIFTAADNLSPRESFPLLAKVLDRSFDPRFIKSIVRSFRIHG